MRGERLSQHVSAVSPIATALDGTPVKKRRAASKAAAKPVIGTIFVCHCGERFDDQREAWIHVRAEYADLRRTLDEMRKLNGDRLIAECGTLGGASRHQRRREPPCEACREAKAERTRQWKAANRERVNAQARAREALPENRAKRTARKREKRAIDPDVTHAREQEYRVANWERIKAQQRAWYAANREKILARRAAQRVGGEAA